MVCFSRFWLRCVLLIALATAIRSSGDHEWEWAGGFDVHTDEQYTWVASKVNGAYADATMKILILSASSSSSDGIESAESEAETLFEAGNATSISAPSSTVLSPGTLYQLVFDADSPHSLFFISFSTSTTTRNEDDESAFVIFTEHVPSEFENGIHYLQDEDGNDVEPVATEPATTTEYNNAGWAMLASFVVAIASTLGVVLTVPTVRWAVEQYNLFAYLNAFASGAILAVNVFLVIPEALANIATRHPGENSRAAWFGSMLLGGFILVAVIDWIIRLFFPDGHTHTHAALHSKDPSKDNGNGNGWPGEYAMTAPAYVLPYASPAVVELQPSFGPTFATPYPPPVDFQYTMPAPYMPTPTPYMSPAPYIPTPLVPAPEVVRNFCDCWPLNGVVWSVLLGDGLHNFVDGVLIGFAFRYCGESTGWTVAAGALFHELGAELAEFYMLLEQGGLTWLQALVINFISSLTIFMGALITSYVEISNYALGLILAFSAGVLLFLAIVPIWHSLTDRHITPLFLVVAFLSFALGCTVIGLILLYHQHCDAGGSHAGHNH